MKSETWWGLYNFGVLLAVERLRRDAVQNARSRVNSLGAESDWKRYYQIRKVIVTEPTK